MNPDQLAHLGEALTIVVVGWRVLAKINKLLSLFEEFPLHRHINGKVIYPKGYAPDAIEKLNANF